MGEHPPPLSHDPSILYLHARALPLQVALREERVSARRADFPVAIVEGRGSRAVVKEANARARRRGILAGMNAALARRLSPSTLFIAHREGVCKRVWKGIMELVSPYSPILYDDLEAGVGLDLRGCRRLWGTSLNVAERILRDTREKTGILLSAGGADHPLPALLASIAAPPFSILSLLPWMENDFLLMFPISHLPGFTGLLKDLEMMGINRLKDASLIPPRLLVYTFGEGGARLAHLLDPHHRPERGGGIEVTLPIPSGGEPPLASLLKGTILLALEEALSLMERGGGRPDTVEIRVRYGDGRSFSKISRLSGPDPLPIVQEFIALLPERRVAPEDVRVRLSPSSTPPLFPPGPPPLLSALFRIRERFGTRAIVRGGISPSLGEYLTLRWRKESG